ncbi:hypothetical protein [Solicola sp. PLA-1-18]|uniref:hypothetical protein n=1 Tax=Solicola sp. PLA-1-18 TaxID=3380532 RepID=UPI003B7C1D21
MSTRTRWTVTATLAVTALLAGCGGTSPDTAVPATGRALTAAVIDDIGNEPTAAGTSKETDDLGRDAVTADVRFGRGARPYTISVLVAPEDQAPQDACGTAPDGCDRISLPGGDPATLAWNELDPDKDPGSVTITTVRDGSVVVVRYRGTALRRDPRSRGAMPVRFEPLADLAADPTIAVETTQRRVDQGDKLSVWE